jgi:hypothetical protein
LPERLHRLHSQVLQRHLLLQFLHAQLVVLHVLLRFLASQQTAAEAAERS